MSSEIAGTPQPTVGMRRALNVAMLVALHVLPSVWRRRMGWWRWDEILAESSDYETALAGIGTATGPVACLLRRGFRLPSEMKPWPKAFRCRHRSWNYDNGWGAVPESEMSAWATVWQSHPLGQAYLDTALAGAADAGLLGHVKALLASGADPLGPSGDEPEGYDSSFMHYMWRRGISAEKLAIWAEVCGTNRVPLWDLWAAAESRLGERGRATVENLDTWKASGLPLPSPQAALVWALAWVEDPPLSDGSHADIREELSEGLAAVRWWKSQGILPAEASTRLLQEWLTSARPGSLAYYQDGMSAWAEVLLKNGLPSPPPHGPQWSVMDDPDGPMPWSHWMLAGHFFENIPAGVRQRLFSEPNAWTARNASGHTARDILERRCDEHDSESRDEDLQKLKAWGRAQILDKVLEQNRITPDSLDATGSAPAVLPRRRL